MIIKYYKVGNTQYLVHFDYKVDYEPTVVAADPYDCYEGGYSVELWPQRTHPMVTEEDCDILLDKIARDKDYLEEEALDEYFNTEEYYFEDR